MGNFRPTDLENLLDDAEFGISKALASIEARDSDERSGYSYFAGSYEMRRLAVCELLRNANVPRFRDLLIESARLRLRFLERVQDGHKSEELYLCASRNLPFINALVAGEVQLACAIARLSATTHYADVEYEDDFLLYHFLHSLLLNTQDAASVDLKRILERWSAVLDGGSDSYLDVCKALVARDQTTFEAALVDVINKRADKLRSDREKLGPRNQNQLAEGFVFMGGLALIRLAELAGMQTDREYEMIPSLARLPMISG